MMCVFLALHHDQTTLIFSSLLILFRFDIVNNSVKSHKLTAQVKIQRQGVRILRNAEYLPGPRSVQISTRFIEMGMSTSIESGL